MSRRPIPGVPLDDAKPELARLQRRMMLRGSLSFGALAMLTGCDMEGGHDAIDQALRAMSSFNDRVQAALFDPDKLVPTYAPSQVTHPFRFNAYYPEWQVRTVDEQDWRLEVKGLVENRSPWSLADLRRLPQQEQITRHICVEGWSQIGQWSGIPLKAFLQHVGADLRAGYVNFICFDDYWCGIDMASALHPQTILTLDFEQKPLTPPWGAPLRLRIPTKLGFKNPKYIQAIEVTNTNPGGFWAKQGYNWFSGL